MSYSIELYFDCHFEQKICHLWDQLSAAGVPSIVQMMGGRPHISLAVLEAIDEEQATNLLEAFVNGFSQFKIEFPAIGLIPGCQQTVYLAPVISASLLEIQKQLFQLLESHNSIPFERYQPNNWLPHCTLSKELTACNALTTLGICQSAALTGTAQVIELGLIEFRPRREIKTFVLEAL